MRMLVLLSVLFLLGCGPPLIPLPKTPTYQTNYGRGCAMDCQNSYNECIRALRSGYRFTVPGSESINACRQMLSECYDLCLGNEETSLP